jgi:hypothetical protein
VTPSDLRTAALAALTPVVGEVTSQQVLAVLDVHGLRVTERAEHAALEGAPPLRARHAGELGLCGKREETT